MWIRGTDRPVNRLLSAGFWVPESSGLRWSEKLRSAAAASLAILFVGWVGTSLSAAGNAGFMVASMGASAVIVFAVPNSPMARPWAIVGGHLISGSLGLLCARWNSEPWVAAAAAVGLSILAMHLSRCLHPPGGASALIPTLGGMTVQEHGIQFLLMPLALNVTSMLAASLVFQILRRRANAGRTEARTDPPPLERLGIRTADLHNAVLEMNAFVDISEDDLRALYNLAAKHAVRREFGAITCAHIMTREVVAVEFGEDLETIWRHFEHTGVRALPVVSRGRQVLGMITPTDFLRHSRHGGFEGFGDRFRHLIRRTTAVTSSKPEVAGQIMSRPALTAREDLPIAEVAVQLAGDIRQIAIVDAQDKLTGLVTQSDLIGALQRALAARTWATPESGDTDATGCPAPAADPPA